MIGANDMAFPRLNAFAYWLNVPAGIILLCCAVVVSSEPSSACAAWPMRSLDLATMQTADWVNFVQRLFVAINALAILADIIAAWRAKRTQTTTLVAAWKVWKLGGNKLAWKMYRCSSMFLALLFFILMADQLI